MKLTRNQFFATLFGGAVAGPMVVKVAVEAATAVTPLSSPPYHFPEWLMGPKADDPHNWNSVVSAFNSQTYIQDKMDAATHDSFGQSFYERLNPSQNSRRAL